MPDLVGQTLLGRYRIEELVGRGGMAEVYKAWDTRRQYHVAVKVMREDLAEDLEFLRRFKREAQALAHLAHANVVRFYSFEREGHLAFIVMDYVSGTTLRRRILEAESTSLPLNEVLSITQQVCAALHYAHEENVLHRDVKPGNIMIQPDGRVLVADFGIAKAADAATATTVMPGTPAYMSPEQCRSEPLDVRTDIYSLGIVVYEMLAGRRPFVGESEEAGTGSTRERIRWEQVHAAPPPLRRYNPELPREVEEVVLKALAKEREGRWPTPLAFRRALEVVVGVKVPAAAPITRRVPEWAWATGGVIVVIGLLMLLVATGRLTAWLGGSDELAVLPSDTSRLPTSMLRQPTATATANNVYIPTVSSEAIVTSTVLPVSTSAPGPTQTLTPYPAEQVTTTYTAVYHTVQRGENIFRIALRYGTTVKAIAIANGMTNPAVMYVGQVLLISCARQEVPTEPLGETTYVVQPGDNLFRVALRYNISYLYLAQYNGITSSGVHIGQVLRIPPH